MKGTAIGLIILSVYWVLQGVEVVRAGNMHGFVNVILGLALLPLAKYVWGKNIDGTTSK